MGVIKIQHPEMTSSFMFTLPLHDWNGMSLRVRSTSGFAISILQAQVTYLSRLFARFTDILTGHVPAKECLFQGSIGYAFPGRFVSICYFGNILVSLSILFLSMFFISLGYNEAQISIRIPIVVEYERMHWPEHPNNQQLHMYVRCRLMVVFTA